MRPGYANFAVADPPLKLVLIEDRSREPGSLNHLGVEVGSTEEVAASRARFAAEGLTTAVEDQVECSYALQDKVWVDGPGGEPWEVYTLLPDTGLPARKAPEAGRTQPECCAARHDLMAAPIPTTGPDVPPAGDERQRP